MEVVGAAVAEAAGEGTGDRRVDINKLLNEMSDQRFEYGEMDCFVFTASCVLAWHGKNFLESHAGQYEDQESADDYVQRHGGMARMVTADLGPPIRSPLVARDGDVVLAVVTSATRSQAGLGFVVGGRALFKGARRVLALPLGACSLAWRIS